MLNPIFRTIKNLIDSFINNFPLAAVVMGRKILILTLLILALLTVAGFLFFNLLKPTGENCGEYFDCFMSAAEDCSEANMTYVTEINVFGLLSTQENLYMLKKTKNGECSIGFEVISTDLEYSDAAIKSMMKKGMTKDEIDQRLESPRESASQSVGREGACVGNSENIVMMLRNLQSGTYSIPGLYSDLECSGSYFESWSISDSESECRRSSDCQKGFHCTDSGECVNDNIFNTFDDCINRACNQICTNCRSGKYTCGQSSVYENKCVECLHDPFCSAGYTCQDYRCVPE